MLETLVFTRPSRESSRPALEQYMHTQARSILRTSLLFLLFAAAGFAPSAWGWGCKGHQVVALIAEAHLTRMRERWLRKFSTQARSAPTCAAIASRRGLDAFADSSTWADDERTVRPETVAGTSSIFHEARPRATSRNTARHQPAASPARLPTNWPSFASRVRPLKSEPTRCDS